MFRKLFVPFAFALLWYSCINNSAAAGTGPIGKEITAGARRFIEISAEDLEDKIRGGLLAQLLGNLNGLPHENKYYDEPGNVEQYTPALEEYPKLPDVLFNKSPGPAGDKLRAAALAAGLKKP